MSAVEFGKIHKLKVGINLQGTKFIMYWPSAKSIINLWSIEILLLKVVVRNDMSLCVMNGHNVRGEGWGVS